MRVIIRLTTNTELVPNNFSVLSSYIHKCLGTNNKYHDVPSNYSISKLCGGWTTTDNRWLNFKDGAYFTVSSPDAEFVSKFITGVISNPVLGYGLMFKSIDHISEEFYNGWNHFGTLSPFILTDKTRDFKFINIDDDNFSNIVQERTKNKLAKFNPSLNLANFKLVIENSEYHKVRKLYFKNFPNFANQCHVSVYTNKKVAEYLYYIGLGQSTGSGFGALYKTENYSSYFPKLEKEIQCELE